MDPQGEAVEAGSRWQRSSWRTLAACNGSQAELFYPPAPPAREGRDERLARERAAKRVCAGCPVRTQCLDYAIAASERHGVWGGLTELERRRLTRRAG